MAQTLSAPSGTAGLILSPRLIRFVVVALLAVFAGLLYFSVRQESQTFDEADHLFAGFEYWKHGDFGRNPEHPPLAKLAASLPILSMGLKEPAPLPIPFFKAQDFFNSAQLIYSGDADAALLRGRMVIALFSLTLGVLVFFAGREMFGELAGILALGLFVFEPVLLANGALVTTDVPLACLYFASVYGFYRYVKRPTVLRLGLCALATALAVATKHSGFLILPTLLVLALVDVLAVPEGVGRGRRLFRLGVALLAIAGVSYFGLWAVYGFRYAARPGGLEIVPPMVAYIGGIPSAWQRSVLFFLARHHLFPQAYLYGWADILRIPGTRGTFVLGRHHALGTLVFFPAVFVIKTTLVVMLLLLLAPWAGIRGRRREFLFLVLPVFIFGAVAVFSKLNMGVRHLMPLYPFCMVIAGAAAGALAVRSRWARVAVAGLLLFDVVSSLHSFPDYLSYSNEIAGGPARTYRLVGDSNDDWGQGLKWTKSYLDKHPTSECWIAHMNPIVDPKYYGIPCKALPSGFAHLLGMPLAQVPPVISGTVFVSSTEVVGYLWGPDSLNPYEGFRLREPDERLGNVELVYHGSFSVPLLAAETEASRASQLLGEHRVPEALTMAQDAAKLAPDSADVTLVLAQALTAAGESEEAGQASARTRELARTIHPELQKSLQK
jgi:Dolichyl-phosphate-mannose-protein mannosyltransferase